MTQTGHTAAPGIATWALARLTLRRMLLTMLCSLLVLLTAPPLLASARAVAEGGPVAAASSGRAAGIDRQEAQTLQTLLAVLPSRYESARATHDVALAAPVRLIVRRVRERVLESSTTLSAAQPVALARALHTLDALGQALQPTSERFEPWPVGFEVEQLSARGQLELGSLLHVTGLRARSYGEVNSALGALSKQAQAGRSESFEALHVFALYAGGPGRALLAADPTLDEQITRGLLIGGASAPGLAELIAGDMGRTRIVQASAQLQSQIDLAAQVLGLVKVSRTTIVVNGAIIVFREGLEAVLILAAITASFVGAKRHLRRPVLLGALAGLAATVLTWVVAQLLLHLLGNGGLELQAITGLVAIGVLLLVTNWFFHRVYWSQWISRFNRRRKALERLDRLGFVSGQALGLVVLGLSSVYREGLETVLFLQALQTSAGTGTAALGAGIGLAGTLIVGTVTFKLQRKLPFKRMLILTGVLIALVLAVMVGTTVHNIQGVGWLGSTTTSFNVPLDWSTWLGVYPTWQGIGAQLGALAFVVGSYIAAREIQVKRPQRRARHGANGEQALAAAQSSSAQASVRATGSAPRAASVDA